MVPLSIAKKLQKMNKFLDGPILHLLTGFAYFNSLALSLQAGNLIFRQTKLQFKRDQQTTWNI